MEFERQAGFCLSRYHPNRVQAMPLSTLADTPMWFAVMKRTVNDRAPQ